MAHEMQTPTGADPGYGASYGAPSQMREGHGWLVFAAVMFFAAAAANALWGIAALVNDSYFRVDELLFGDLSMWGVIYLVFAAVQALTAFLILRRSTLGVVLGIGIALLNAVLVLLSIGGYPLWSVIILVIDGLIIYGLSVYGFEET